MITMHSRQLAGDAKPTPASLTKINLAGMCGMKRLETYQKLTTKKAGMKTVSLVNFSLDEETRRYANKLFELRVKRWGDESEALEECAGWSGMSARSFKRLMDGETKKASAFFGRIRKGYLDYVARKAAELLAVIEEEKGRYGNVRIGDLDKEMEALVAKIEAARAIKIIDPKGL